MEKSLFNKETNVPIIVSHIFCFITIATPVVVQSLKNAFNIV